MCSLFGAVFQAVLGLGAIFVCIFLWYMTGESALVIISFLVVCLCEVYWVIAVIGCLANIRWLDMLTEENMGADDIDHLNESGMDQDGREQLIDEE